MAGRSKILKFLLVLIGGMLLSGLVLGILGFFLAGREGFGNMFTFGLVLGLLGSFSKGFSMLIGAHYGTGHVQEFSRDEFRKMSEGEDDTPDY